MTGLSRREQRAWRRITRSLSEHDPHLAGKPSEARAGRVLSVRLCAVFVAVALVLILVGLVIHDFQMVMGGLVVLWMMPLVCGLVLATRGSHRDER